MAAIDDTLVAAIEQESEDPKPLREQSKNPASDSESTIEASPGIEMMIKVVEHPARGVFHQMKVST